MVVTAPLVPHWNPAKKLKVKGPKSKKPKAAPRKKKKETNKIMNLVFFNSFSFKAGFTKDQNCQNIKGNAIIIPPINAILIALKN